MSVTVGAFDQRSHRADFQPLHDPQRSIDAARELLVNAFVLALFEHGHRIVIVDPRRIEIFPVLRIAVSVGVDRFGRIAQHGLPHDELVGIGAFARSVSEIVVYFQTVVDQRLPDIQPSAQLLVVRLFHQPDVVRIDDAGTVVQFGRTARRCHAVILTHGMRTGDGIEPVGRSSVIIGCGLIGKVFPDSTAVLLSRHEIGFPVDALHRHVCRKFDAVFARTRFLGRHENDTVRTARAVDRRRGTVLEHVDRSDILGAHVGKIAAHDAVDHHQRRGTSRHRRHSAQLDLHAAVRIASLRTHDIQSGDLTLKQLQGIGNIARLEVVALEGGDRTGQLLFGGRSVADHHHVVHLRNGFREPHVDRRFRSDGKLLIFVTDERETETRIVPAEEFQRVSTVRSRTDAVGGSFFDYAHADQRIARGVCYPAGDRTGSRLLPGNRQRDVGSPERAVNGNPGEHDQTGSYQDACRKVRDHGFRF